MDLAHSNIERICLDRPPIRMCLTLAREHETKENSTRCGRIGDGALHINHTTVGISGDSSAPVKYPNTSNSRSHDMVSMKVEVACVQELKRGPCGRYSKKS
jgi:hypothetical protein